MSQIAAALCIFSVAVIGSFAWYGYRQAHVFWKWSVLKWAKVLGISAVAAFVGSALYYDYSGGREASKGARAECQRALNSTFQDLMTAAKVTEDAVCAATNRFPYPIWEKPFFIDDFKCGISPTADSINSYQTHDMEAPPCNTEAVKEFSCGTVEELDTLMARCGLYQGPK